MDALAADRRFLDEALTEALTEIEARLERGPSRRMGAGTGLRDHGRAVLVAITKHRDEAASEFDEAVDDDGTPVVIEQRAALAKLRKAVLLARHLRFSMVALDRVADPLGLGAAYVLRDIASHLIDDAVDLIEQPIDGTTYGTTSWPFQAVLKKGLTSVPESGLEKVRGSTPGGRPVMLLFPRTEASNVLLFPLLIHEMGHPCWEVRDLSRAVWGELRRAGWVEKFADVLADAEAPEGTNERVMRWRLEEFFCDLIACALLGPSYLFAFAAWVGAIDLGGEPRRHPPTALRIEVMLGFLRAHHWTQLEECEAVCAWLDQLVESEKAPGSGGMHPQTVEALRQAAGSVSAQAVAVAGDRMFLPADYSKQAAVVEQELRLGILPAQLNHDGTAADPRVILLAGWLDRLRDGTPTDLVKALGDRRYQAFLDKALEMSVVLSRWSDS